MRLFYRRLVIFTICVQSGAALAAPLRPVTLEIRNATGNALECQILAAHWYTLPGLALAPGQAGTVSLFAADGVVQTAERLPVERIFCGLAGNAWQTRGEVDLRGLAAGEGAAVVCRVAGDAVGCGG